MTDKEGLHTLHTSVQSHGERVRNSYDNCEEANVRVSKFIFEQDKPKVNVIGGFKKTYILASFLEY